VTGLQNVHLCLAIMAFSSGEVILRVTFAATQDLGLCGFIRRTSTHDVRNINKRMGTREPLDIPEVGLGA
jgi:hypothetical protein